jgi:hypothetical protein
MIEMGDRLTYVQMQRDEIATFGKQCMAYGFTGRDIDKIAEVTRRHVTNVTGITSDMHQMSPAAQQEALHGMRRRVGYDFVKAVTDNRYKANLRAQKNERDGAMQRELGLIEARYEAGMQFLRKRLGNGHVDQAELKIAQDSYTQSFVAQMSGIHG